jgi:signal transduction histidine kinase
VPESGLAVYRTVQEALTNTAKYAGRGARAWVRLTYQADTVEVEIVDNGRSAGAAGAEVPDVSSSGYGLAGIRERAALLGGRATSGPTPEGFRVAITLPAPPAAGTPQIPGEERTS